MAVQYMVKAFVPTIAGCGARDNGWDDVRCSQFESFLNRHAVDGWRFHSSEYREVAAPERLVFTITDEPDGDRYELVTVVLTELGEGLTEMHFEQRGHQSPDEYERAGEGWGGFFARIAERLTR